jgi:hypothetical protein
MTRDQLMFHRQRAIEALGDKSEAVRTAADIILRLWPAPQEWPHEKRLRNE